MDSVELCLYPLHNGLSAIQVFNALNFLNNKGLFIYSIVHELEIEWVVGKNTSC